MISVIVLGYEWAVPGSLLSGGSSEAYGNGYAMLYFTQTLYLKAFVLSNILFALDTYPLAM
jgi:hypothetical protein